MQDCLYISTARNVINITTRRTSSEWVDIKPCRIQGLTLYDSSRKWELFNSALSCLVFKLLTLISSSWVSWVFTSDLRKLKRLVLRVNFLEFCSDFSSKYSLICLVKDLRFGLRVGSPLDCNSGDFRVICVLTNFRSLNDRFRLIPRLSKVNWF